MTSSPAIESPMKYLDRALMSLRDLGLVPEQQEAQPPIVPLLNEITGLDENRVVAIARTLDQASFFNEIVREQVEAMNIADRYEDITKAFNSIRDDAKSLVDQLADGKLDTWERLANVWMKVSRGDISARFDEIRDTYSLKQAEVLALEVLEKAKAKLDQANEALAEAARALEAVAADAAPADRARLELQRDERLRAMQDEEKRYQIAKDLADNLTVGYNTSEVIMARLMQTTSAKERVYAQAVSFFSTNDTVLTALRASFTGLHGLHESTKTLEAMKEGISKSLETLSEVGDQVQEAAIRAGYGPTIRADAVRKLVDSVVNFQERSREIITEMRRLSTENSKEIRDAVEEGKRRLARLAAEGNALVNG